MRIYVVLAAGAEHGAQREREQEIRLDQSLGIHGRSLLDRWWKLAGVGSVSRQATVPCTPLCAEGGELVHRFPEKDQKSLFQPFLHQDMNRLVDKADQRNGKQRTDLALPWRQPGP
jgi:hypothetical protein